MSSSEVCSVKPDRLPLSVEALRKPTCFFGTDSLMTLQNSFFTKEMKVVTGVSFPFDSMKLTPDVPLQKLQLSVLTETQHLFFTP